MDTASKKKRRNIIFAAVAVVLAGALVALPFILDARQKSLDNNASILSAPVTVGTIRKTLSGTGTLADEEAQEVSVPQGVKVTEYLVENGQYVKEGDPVAAVDTVSVMETISTLRESMSEVEAEMDALGSGFDFTTIISSAPGRVKAVYAHRGEAVKDVIARDGALAVISLDGKMSVQFRPSSILFVGQTVPVELSDGKQVDGRVDTIVDGEVTVTVSDEYGAIGEAVRIVGEDGQELGSGTLSIHSPMRVIAADGTVDTVLITEGRTVSAYSELFVLSGTSVSGTYQALATEHRKYEDMMARLFVMYQDGVLSAPCDGCISGVDKSILKQLSASDDDTPGISLLIAREEDTPALEQLSSGDDLVGLLLNGNSGGSEGAEGSENDQNTLKRSDGVIISVNENGTVTAMMQPSDTDPEMNGERIFTPPEGEWKKDDSFTIIYYGSDGNIDIPVMMIPKSQNKPDSGGGNMPNGGGMSGMTSGGGMTGMGGMTTQVENDRFPTTETTILSVTPQDTMTVEITVDELDILSVRAGQEAAVTLDALKGQAFTGTITRVNTTSSNEGGNSKYTAEVELPRTAYMLGGMNASVNITVEERENVLLIPSASLTELDGKPAVYTAWDSRSEELQNLTVIETGLSDGQQVQVLSGLSEGELVWYRYYDKLESNGLPG